jgi:hypothetical protein
MIQLNGSNRVVVVTDNYSDTYGYQLKSMVRVLGLAMQAEPDVKNQDCLIDFCALLEQMLPMDEQIVLSKEESSVKDFPLKMAS